MSKQDNLSDKAKAMLAEVAPAQAPVVPTGSRLAPTPEQMRGGRFVRESAKTAHGQVIAIAYRRQPLFETMAKGKTGIDAEGLAALRFYRNRYEESAQSLTRCALDMEARGGGLPLCLPPGLYSDEAVRRCEMAMGAVANTMRAVALEDQTFREIAIARFGGREVSRIDVGAGRRAPRHQTTIEPRSGRHREIIRREFVLGLERLTMAVVKLTSTTTLEAPREPAPESYARPPGITVAADAPAIDASFLDERGMMKPAAEIAEIVRGRVEGTRS